MITMMAMSYLYLSLSRDGKLSQLVVLRLVAGLAVLEVLVELGGNRWDRLWGKHVRFSLNHAKQLTKFQTVYILEPAPQTLKANLSAGGAALRLSMLLLLSILRAEGEFLN